MVQDFIDWQRIGDPQHIFDDLEFFGIEITVYPKGEIRVIKISAMIVPRKNEIQNLPTEK